MNFFKKIIKNTSLLLISQIINNIIGFFYLIFAARYLGTEGFGNLAFAISFTGVFGILADMGLSYLMTREVSRDFSNVYKYFGNIITIKIFLSIITFFLIILTVIYLNYTQEIKLIIILIGLSVIIGTFSFNINSLFQAYEKMEYQAISQVLGSLIILIGALIIINYNYNIVGFAFIYLASSIITFLFNLIVYFKNHDYIKLQLNLNFVKKILKEALPFGLNSVSFQVYLWIDTIILFIIMGNMDVGYYNAAYRLIIILFILNTALNTSIFPLMSKLHINSKKSLILVVNKFMKLMIFIAIPLCALIMIYSKEIIIIIYGVNYIPSVMALQILVWSAFFIFIRSPIERLYESINRQKIITIFYTIGIIFNIIFNLLLIPKYTFIGSSIAILITDLILFLFLTIFIIKLNYHVFNKLVIVGLKVSIATFIIGIFIIYTKEYNIYISLILAVLFYIIIIHFLKVLDDKDIHLIKSLKHK